MNELVVERPMPHDGRENVPATVATVWWTCGSAAMIHTDREAKGREKIEYKVVQQLEKFNHKPPAGIDRREKRELQTGLMDLRRFERGTPGLNEKKKNWTNYSHRNVPVSRSFVATYGIHAAPRSRLR